MMNVLLKARNIYVEYMRREVLDIHELEIYDYDRIGLVGANGAGKSTLLKVLLGEMPLSSGKVVREGNFAYIPQLEDAVDQEVKDYAVMGKLGVDRLQGHRSGGEETRLKIAQALSGQVHGIFADEPTSHLDREGVDLLINHLKYFNGAMLIISHDRYFLDNAVDKIWELKEGKITEIGADTPNTWLKRKRNGNAKRNNISSLQRNETVLRKPSPKKRSGAKAGSKGEGRFQKKQWAASRKSSTMRRKIWSRESKRLEK